MMQAQDHTGTNRNETAFSEEDVRCLREQGDGWERVWERLYCVLNDRLHRMIVGGRANDPTTWRSRAKWFGDPNLAMDFISHYLMQLARKARAGTLLTGYDGEAIVEVYLTAPSHVRRRALSFIASITPIDGGIVELGGIDPPAEPAPSTGSGIAPDAHPLRIDWPGHGGISAVVRMAMLQCWPRVDPRQPGRDHLENDLHTALRTAGASDPVADIDRHHRAAEKRLRTKIAKITNQIVVQVGLHETTRQRLEQERLAAQVDLLLCPLSAEVIQDLYAIGLPAVYKQLSRYRRAYPELFTDLQDALERSVGAL